MNGTRCGSDERNAFGESAEETVDKKLIEGADASLRISMAKYGRNDSVTASLVELSPVVHR